MKAVRRTQLFVGSNIVIPCKTPRLENSPHDPHPKPSNTLGSQVWVRLRVKLRIVDKGGHCWGASRSAIATAKRRLLLTNRPP